MYGEEELVLVHRVAREVLEHDVHIVGIFGQVHIKYMCALRIRKCHIHELAMVEVAEVVAHCRAGEVPAAVVRGAPTEGRLKMCMLCGVAGDGVVGRVAAAAPCDKRIGARGKTLDIHHVAACFEFVAGLVFLPHDIAVGVDDIEGHLIDFGCEGVGVLEVTVVDKAHLIVGVAISFFVVDHAVARGKHHSRQHRQQPRECLEYV